MKQEAISAPGPAPASARTGFWKDSLRDYGLLFSLLVIMGFFYFLTDGISLAPLNVTNLILQNSYVVIMALGMLLIIVGGNIDLSVGSIVGFVGAIAATLMVGFHAPWLDMDIKVPWEPVILISLVLGGAIGAASPAICCSASSSVRFPRRFRTSAPASSRTSPTLTLSSRCSAVRSFTGAR
jgi:putative multiple sugar transport system permease protein